MLNPTGKFIDPSAGRYTDRRPNLGVGFAQAWRDVRFEQAGLRLGADEMNDGAVHSPPWQVPHSNRRPILLPTLPTHVDLVQPRALCYRPLALALFAPCGCCSVPPQMLAEARLARTELPYVYHQIGAFMPQPSPASSAALIPLSELDFILTAQLVVAWAGEKGEEPRLGWWRSDLISEFGGEDLFRRLTPHTWEWAVLQSTRETARRKDLEMRQQDHNPDQVLSLFNFGFELDERLEERIRELKQPDTSGTVRSPKAVLPGLQVILAVEWNETAFQDWVEGHGTADFTVFPIGRRLKGEAPNSSTLLTRKLIAGLAPLTPHYSLPHFRRSA